MRGARRQHSECVSADGIIPADAGSTPYRRAVYRHSRDHPRGCGEHLFSLVIVPLQRGSSPRMRGAHAAMRIHIFRKRIIPADAGSTEIRLAWRFIGGDHPRGCGEHYIGGPMSRVRRGSSPRMRGAHDSDESAPQRGRIIPADAGSTWQKLHCCHLPWDHPRGCGEHRFGASSVSGVMGSSPRMRGAPGKNIQPLSVHEDHPRGCGEHDRMDWETPQDLGSSPRMRGAPEYRWRAGL